MLSHVGPALLTPVEVFGRLAGVATAVGAAFLLGGALSVVVAALHAGRRKAAGYLRRWTDALLHLQHRLEELAAGHTLPVLFGKHSLDGLEKTNKLILSLTVSNLNVGLVLPSGLLISCFDLLIKNILQKAGMAE